MLRKIRITLAAVVFTLITLLFFDVTGLLHTWLGWLAKIQFLPALFAMNFVVVAVLIVLTLVFGRIYCSVICPLGILQDIVSRLHGIKRKNRFRYSAEKKVLRYGFLVVFLVAFFVGLHAVVSLLEPYSAYGRIATNLFRPVYEAGNNVLAAIAERLDSYAFYSVDVWIKSVPTLVVALLTFILIAILAWRGGRTYCNTVCPVGTVLGFLARFSWFKVRIDEQKCVGCGLCAKNCKASAIDFKHHKIDYSRCVVCGDCIGKCNSDAVEFVSGRVTRNEQTSCKTSSYGSEGVSERVTRNEQTSCKTSSGGSEGVSGRVTSNEQTSCKTSSGGSEGGSRRVTSNEQTSCLSADKGRRSFLLGAAMAVTGAALAQKKKKVDGGLAVIEDKVAPERQTPITPPGSFSAQNMARHCTACQLCVSACPNGVLRPSADLSTFMQPMMSYERGYCRPECTRCSQVCPTGAIKPIKREDKSSTQIGHAVWIKKNCVPLTDGVECGNCARHCSVGAITMVPSIPGDGSSPKIPAVNEARCIGCGACENLCPARPFSAIYVEGHEQHRVV